MLPRVYIAAPYQLKDNAAQLRAFLKQHDIDCTSRWIDGTNQLSEAVNASNDLQDVLNAHAVVAINPAEFHNAGTGGRHVEVGFALAHNIPVFVLGGKSNVFHALCIHVDHEAILISALHASQATFSSQHGKKY